MHPENASLAGWDAETRHATHDRRALLVSAVAAVFMGCTSGGALREAHTQLADAYGDATNKQLLLNLARLSRDEPAYFIQLGAFHEQYTFMAGGALQSAYSHATGPSGLQRTITINGGPSASISENPTFNFAPLTGDMFSKLLLRPLSGETFCDLTDAGYRLDVLFRMMVQSIDVTSAERKCKSCDSSAADSAADKTDERCEPRITIVNHPLDPSYADFLQLCYELNRAQLQRLVTAKRLDNPAADFHAILKGAKEGLEASKAGFQVKSIKTTNEFSVTPANSDLLTIKGLADLDPEQYPILSALTSCKYNVTYRLRSFEGLMYAVAQEEGYYISLYRRDKDAKNRSDRNHDGYSATFDQTNGFFTIKNCPNLLRSPEYNVTINADVKGDTPRGLTYNASYTVNDKKTTITAHPILTLTSYQTYPSAGDTTVSLSYRDKRYVIGSMGAKDDEIDYPSTRLPSMSNRNVFSLIAYLFGKASLEPDKLPIQQLIQAK